MLDSQWYFLNNYMSKNQENEVKNKNPQEKPRLKK